MLRGSWVGGVHAIPEWDSLDALNIGTAYQVACPTLHASHYNLGTSTL